MEMWLQQAVKVTELMNNLDSSNRQRASDPKLWAQGANDGQGTWAGYGALGSD